MSDPLVSIVTPCYRQARFLPDAIQTVRQQSYRRIEHVIVNDGSDDDTDAVVARYGQGVVYVKQPNRGVSAARNAGVAAATGQYLMFLDADDLLHPDAVRWLVEAMDGQSNRLCVMGLRLFDPEEHHHEDRLLPCGVPALPRLFEDNLAPPHGYLCSKKMVQEIGGFDTDPAVWSCEDWDLWLRIALRGAELVTVARIGAFYRRYVGSVSSHFERLERARIRVLGGAIRQIKNDPQLLRQWRGEVKKMRRKLAQGYFDVGYRCARRGEPLAALAAYARSLQCGFALPAVIAAMFKTLAHAARAAAVGPAPEQWPSPLPRNPAVGK